MGRSTTRGAAHRWKVLAVGVAANASFAAALGGIPATGVLIRSDYRIGTGELGVVLGMLGLGIVLSELPWGLLTDRWGDRRVLLTGLSTTALALVAMALWGAPAGTHTPSGTVLAVG
ncbi:MFS transporter, partial [Paraburkholderia sp. BR14262]